MFIVLEQDSEDDCQYVIPAKTPPENQCRAEAFIAKEVICLNTLNKTFLEFFVQGAKQSTCFHFGVRELFVERYGQEKRAFNLCGHCQLVISLTILHGITYISINLTF